MMDYLGHICVVGAGPIGNHITTELLDRGHKVLLVEAGNLESESSLLGHKDYVFTTTSMLPENVHRVGGGGNYWIGRIGEFLTRDFHSQPGIRNQKWPLNKDVLLPYYLSVYSKLIDSPILDEDFISKHFAESIDVPDGLGIRPIRYTEPHRLRNLFLSYMNHPNLVFLENTLATSIGRRDGFRNPILHIETASGITEEILVDKVIIAGGALQSTKLFLNSPEIHNLDNTRSAGYFLMEHLDGYIGDIRISRKNKRFIHQIVLDSNRKLVERREMNCGVSLILGSSDDARSPYINVGFEFVGKAVNYRFAPRVNGSIPTSRNILTESVYFLERIIRKVSNVFGSLIKARIFGIFTYSIWLKAEELPYENSFVKVDTPTMKLNYSHLVSIETSNAVRNALMRLQSLVQANNLGKLKFYEHVTNGSQILSLRPNWHPMGTLRMGNPGVSVVDQDLRIHGHKDIYVLSSAVFPTGSNQNPVFTTLALGTRLADELSRYR